ncbi:hypothetical protein BKA64DRAFT_668049 [Cadophora sp. MPI-SDFR-AT-0126]|nr:hypothetical protein BKA64DRAFT_668049 [Leotiomycetes sp. MPI-SDFR-AT-0126]
MAPRIFITGATGYVGGDFIALLHHERPNYEIRALVRSSQQACTLASHFPKVHCILAPPEPHGLLVDEGEAADVVVQIANSDDEPMSLALLAGVAKHVGGAYLHISGTATLIDPSFPLGELDSRVYSDAAQAAEILCLPRDRLHAAVEQKIIETAEELHARVAIVSLPVMYGRGRGPTAPHSKFFEPYIRAVLSHGKAFVIGRGQNAMSNAHVSDASSALLLLVDEALKGESSNASWGKDGYYFVETCESSFMEDAKVTAELLEKRGVIRSTGIDSLDRDSATQFWSFGPVLWGSNARCRAERLAALVWQRSHISRKESLEEMIDYIFDSEQG